jgi:hypothetical protein
MSIIFNNGRLLMEIEENYVRDLEETIFKFIASLHNIPFSTVMKVLLDFLYPFDKNDKIVLKI